MMLFCFGTRPEWLKIKPIISKLEKHEYQLLFTGQHPDLLSNLTVDYRISINDSINRLDQLISDCLIQFPVGNFTSVMVQGDTASAFACALAAFNKGLKIYYLEAGLRSYNLNHPYPEEAYRQMISRIADVCYAPTELSAENLRNEKVSGEIIVTGNTVLDNLIHLKDSCSYDDIVLVTMHRRENHHWISDWFTEINKLAIKNSNLKFILPIHPNPNVQKHRGLLTNIEVVDPLSHNELLDILTKSKLVITDSGGLQEEGSFFNKKVIVCRETTERPEAIETEHLYLCKTPNELELTFNQILINPQNNKFCPYGDGYSSEKIINHIKLKK